MASLGEAFISVVADTSQFEDTLTEGLKAAVGRTVLGGVLGGVVAAGVSKAIKEFLPLEKAILQVFQVQGVNASNEMFAALEQQIYAVSNEVARPAEEVGAAIALGVGRGFDQAASVALSKISGKLANALGESLPDSVKLLTAALNGFNIPAEKATEVAGTLFQAISKSGAPVGQFAQQLGSLGPLATNAGIGLETTAAAIATMVQNGNSPAEAVTNLRTAITELTDSQTTGGKVFKEISGKTFPEFIKQGGTLQQAFLTIDAATKKSGYSLSDLTSNYNTQNAIVALTGERTAQFSQNLADTKTGADSMSAALESAEQGGLFRFNEAINKLKNGVKEIGGSFRPLLDVLAAKLAPAVDWAAGALTKLSDIVSQIDFAQAGQAIDFLVTLLTPIGQLIMSIYNVLSALNWDQIFDAFKAAAVPTYILLGAVSAAAKLLAEVIEYLTPVLRPLVDIISYLAVPLIAVYSALKAIRIAQILWIATLGATRVALLVLGPLIRILTVSIRGMTIAVRLLNAAFGPLGVVTALVIALAAAFIYAWKKSETFRNIVVSTWNTVKDATLTAIQVLLDAYVSMVTGFLSGFKALLSGLGHLPKWLGGGAADGAANAVQSLINGVNSLSSSLDGLIEKAKAADWTLNNLGIKGPISNDEFQKQAKQFFADQKKAAGPSIPKITPPNTSGLGNLLDPQKAGGTSAADKAKQTAKTIKDLLQGIYDDVRDFVKGIGEKSLDQIQNGFGSIIDKYRDAIETAAELGQKTVVARLKKSLAQIKAYEKTIEKLAKKRDGLTDKITAAEEALKAVQDFQAAAKAAFVDLGKVSEGSAGIGVTFLGIRNNLRDAIRTTTAFRTAFKKLQDLNLNETSLRQLADAGPAALDQAMALARSGAGGVKEINKLQKELDDLATKNADAMTKEFFDLGVAQAQGILKGLQSERAALVKEMESLGAAMVNGMKKTLKIKSPSKVFDEIGQQVPAGMTAGIRRGTPDVAAAIAAMAGQRSAAVDVGGINISGVSDPAAARRAGILAGDAIKQTLMSRQSAQVLAGVG